MSEDDILRRVSKLTWQQKMELQAAAHGNARIDVALDRRRSPDLADVGSGFAVTFAYLARCRPVSAGAS